MTLGLGSTLTAMAAGWPFPASAQSSSCGGPAEIEDGWRIAPPEAVGLDGIRLCAMTRWLDNFRPGNIAPGSEWNYSGGCTELLGAVLRKASGKPIETFADETLFAPLGISDVGWARYPDNIPAVASGLQLRPRDLAKIGQLVLQRGLWDGKQIVSEAWIAEGALKQFEKPFALNARRLRSSATKGQIVGF